MTQTTTSAKPVPAKKFKRTFKMSVGVAGATKEFSPGMGVGILTTCEVTYNLTQAQYDSPMFMLNLKDRMGELRDEIINLDAVEVFAPVKARKKKAAA